MEDESNLMVQLESTGPAEWEGAYAARERHLTRDMVFKALTAKRPYAHWLACRFEVGEPGAPLPSPQASFDAVTVGAGTPAHAFRLIFECPALPADSPTDLVLALLVNAGQAALRGGLNWFSAWLAVRAGLAAIALGEPGLVWALLDGISRDPRLGPLSVFLPIRSNPLLEHSIWVRATIARLWPSLGVPAVATLPVHIDPATAPDAAPVLAELRRVEANELAGLVEATMNKVDVEVLKLRASEPLVVALEQILAGDPLPEMVATDLPTWFAVWAGAAFRAGRHQLARQAGRLLYRHHPERATAAAVLVLPYAAASDLHILQAGFSQPETQDMFAELRVAVEKLPREVADALVAVALPGRAADQTAAHRLAMHLEALQNLQCTPGGVVEHVVSMTATIVRERGEEHTLAMNARQGFVARLDRCVSRLGDPRRLAVADIKRAAAELEGPGGGCAQLELAQEDEQLPLARVIQALVLCRGLGANSEAKLWRAVLQMDAVRSLKSLGVPRLYTLRLELLDDLIAALPHDAASRTELYSERAMTRATISESERNAGSTIADDLGRAVRFARGTADHESLASALVAMGKLLERVANRTTVEAVLREQIDFLLGCSLSPIGRARTLHAAGHLLRTSNPEQAMGMYWSAMGHLDADDPYRWEIASDWIPTAIPAGCASRAGEQGLRWISQITEKSSDITIGCLHLATGQALAAGRVSYAAEARNQLERAVERLRGDHPHATAEARLALIQWGLRHEDTDLARMHLASVEADSADLTVKQYAWLQRLREQIDANPSSGEVTAATPVPVQQVFRRHETEDRALALAGATLRELQTSIYPTSVATGIAERAWNDVRATAVVRQVRPEAREREAELALNFALHFSAVLGVESNGDELAGESAAFVTRWLLRSQSAMRRSILSQVRRPDTVPIPVWEDLRRALRGCDPDAVLAAVATARRFAPELLSEDVDMEATWSWLDARPGAVAVLVATAGNIALTSVLQLTLTGELLLRVRALTLPPPPYDGSALSEALRGSSSAPSQASQFHAAMVKWAQRCVIEPLRTLLEGTPSAVLWCPSGALRQIAPQALWPGVPVASTLALPLVNLGHAPSRPRSTLVFMADPGEGADEASALGQHGQNSLAVLVESASLRAPVRQVVSVGRAFGRSVAVAGASVRDTPASAKDLLAEAPAHDVLVVIAHGVVDLPATAALICVNSAGATEWLKVGDLEATPQVFQGATVLMLSCETGRTGGSLSRPGGIAGTLLAAGARAVVAPLWPVRLDAATRAASAVLRGLANGEEPWVALARDGGAHSGEGPAMGPPPPVADLVAADEMQELAFVTWVG